MTIPLGCHDYVIVFVIARVGLREADRDMMSKQATLETAAKGRASCFHERISFVGGVEAASLNLPSCPATPQLSKHSSLPRDMLL